MIKILSKNRMPPKIRRFIIYINLLLCVSVHAEPIQPEPHRKTIFLAGDSTMSIKDIKDYPETGWGEPFSIFFNKNIRIDNRAKNGRSTKSFIAEGRWQGIINELVPGDYVFIQFGHNDESISKKERYTTPTEYKANLTRFIVDSQSHGAHPILLSPITRRDFDGNGKVKQTHSHAPYVLEVAQETKVDFIDMNEITRNYFTVMGGEASALRFMHIRPDLHPNYPLGVRDDTHTNHLGAREIAQLVLLELKKVKSPLLEYLREADPKHMRLEY